MRLYINGIELQITEETKIAQTKQVNNLMSIETRQTNFTNSFKIRKTKPNIVAMRMLGVIGNTSSIPYDVNRVDLFGDTGECFVYQGRCIITTSDPDFYELQILDGNIDIYKSMGNDKLSVLDLSEISHERTVANIIASWVSSTMNYKYIVADFNGKSTTAEGYLNADFLVPSVRVSFLWESLFLFYGFTFSGAFFDTDDFKNLWMTYPKGVQIDNSTNVELFNSDDFYFKTSFSSRHNGRGCFMSFNSASVNTLPDTSGNIRFKVPETGTYRIKINGRITVIPADTPFYNGRSFTYNISLGKNFTGNINRDTNSYNYTDLQVIAQNIVTGEAEGGGVPFEKETFLQLDANDVLFLMLKGNIPYERFYFSPLEGHHDLEFIIEKVTDDVVDFGEALQDFGVKEFFNEIITRYALTPIKDRFSNNYAFHTLDSIINDADSVDWSSKFVGFERENYLYNAYEQRNYFRYKYEDKEAEYNDGYLDVSNKNLDDKKTVYQSQLYSPDKNTSELLSTRTNIYKLWDKKVDKDSNVTYDSLDKRFYFLNYSDRAYTGTLKSELYSQTAVFTSYPIENFNNLSYYNSVLNYYKGMNRLLDKSSVVTAKFKLNDYDISSLDYSKKIFVKMLGYDFFINKISNYLNRTKTVSVELVRISEKTSANNPIVNPITSVRWLQLNGNVIQVRIIYDDMFFTTSLINAEIQGVGVFTDRPNNSPLPVNITIMLLNVPMKVRLYKDYLTTEFFSFILDESNRDSV